MAFKYKRAHSPYWWIKPKLGKAFSTKLRHAIPHETHKANDRLEKAEQLEHQKFAEPERWTFWVPGYIDERYEDSPKSHERYKLRWASIRAFLTRHKIEYPRQLTFNVITLYVPWRRAGDQEHGVWKSSKNTAIGDVKFLGLLMRRAIQLDYATTNPCLGLGLKKTKPEPKQEISDAHLQVIWQALESRPQWMRDWFQICHYTGCRMHEAAIPLDCADVPNRSIHFPTTKGDKPFTVPMREELVPLFTRLQKERPGQTAFDLPERASLMWWKFFDKIKYDTDAHYSLHCLRVTFISRGMRAGIAQHEMMRLVNHASSEINRIYQRFKQDGLMASLQKIALPSLHTHGSSESQDAISSTPQNPPAT